MEITIATILIDNVIVRTREFRSVGKHFTETFVRLLCLEATG